VVFDHHARGRHADGDARVSGRRRALAVGRPGAEQPELAKHLLDRRAGVGGGGQIGDKRKNENQRDTHDAAIAKFENLASHNSSVARRGNRRERRLPHVTIIK